MQSNLLKISIILLFSGCMVVQKSDTYFLGQLDYERLESKRRINSENFDNKPKVKKSTVLITIDSTTQIKHVNTTSINKYQGERYYHVEYSQDTIPLPPIDSNYVPSDFKLSGTFMPKKIEFLYRVNHNGTAFSLDGTCVETRIINCPDGGCSSTYQRKGEYRIIGDTVVVNYFLDRATSNNLHPPVKIEDVQWNINEPYDSHFLISEKRDSLYQIVDSRYGEINTHLVLLDSLNFK